MKIIFRLMLISICIYSIPSFASLPLSNTENSKLKIDLNNFRAVSCDETGNLCIAVGYGDKNPGLNTQIYRTQDGGLNWSTPISLLPVANEVKNNDEPASISCNASGQQCVLLRTATIGTDITPVVYRTSDGGLNWSEPFKLPVPSDAPKKPDFYAIKVSCNGAGNSCMIAATIYTGSNEILREYPMFYTSKDAGQQWALVTTLKEPDRTYNHEYTIQSMNCDHSGLFCVAVGSALTRNSFWSFYYSSKPLVYTTQDGGKTWSDAIILPKDNSGNTAALLTDVACSTSGDNCTAIGWIYDFDTNLYQTFSTSSKNRGVDWEQQISLAPFNENILLNAMACDANAINCTAVGYHADNDATLIKPRVYTTSDSAQTWTGMTPSSPSSSGLVDIFCSKINDSCITVGIQLQPQEVTLRGLKDSHLNRAFSKSLFKPGIIKNVQQKK